MEPGVGLGGILMRRKGLGVIAAAGLLVFAFTNAQAAPTVTIDQEENSIVFALPQPAQGYVDQTITGTASAAAGHDLDVTVMYLTQGLSDPACVLNHPVDPGPDPTCVMETPPPVLYYSEAAIVTCSEDNSACTWSHLVPSWVNAGYYTIRAVATESPDEGGEPTATSAEVNLIVA